MVMLGTGCSVHFVSPNGVTRSWEGFRTVHEEYHYVYDSYPPPVYYVAPVYPGPIYWPSYNGNYNYHNHYHQNFAPQHGGHGGGGHHKNGR